MKKLLFASMLAVLSSAHAQDFYSRSSVQTIEIFFGASNWDAQLDNLASTTEDYLLADSVRINGVTFDSVGVKYKGNSSYNANNNKNPLHIKLDWVKGNADYQGYTSVKLQNGYQDPSMIREVLSYAILEQYMDCPKANFANVYINGTLRGLYSNAESIDERFCGDHYYSADGSFFKCNPVGGAGQGTTGNPDLNYLGMDSSLYANRYELESTYGWNDLVAMINTLNNDFTNIETKLDMDRALWMLAFNNVLVNLDSYSGAFRQNYYLYKDNNERFIPTIWDLNMSFGGFPGGASQGGSTNSTTLDPYSNSASANHPLIVKVLGNPMYKRMYMAHLRTIAQEVFASGDYVDSANVLRATIDASVQADPYKFYTYTQFQNSLTTATSGGQGPPGQSIPGIQALMDARITFFNSNSAYLLQAPTISAYAASNATPSFGDNIYITATCSNETTVYLGYRYAITNKFTRVQMFDDGNHGDGAAGDHVYGVQVTMNGTGFHYYIYAENANAGLFSPQRAEHEYHTLNLVVATPTAGQVLINELMASNATTAVDNYDESDDWVEVYNTTNNLVNLGGLYLSDDTLDLMKWQIPAGTSVAPQNVLIFWTDNDADQVGLHTNFKLSGTGESVILSDGTTVIDRVDFGVQTTDVSYARCPDGATFTFAIPTFNALNNCSLSVQEQQIPLAIGLYPNPSSASFFVRSDESNELQMTVFDLQGRSIYTTVLQNGVQEITSSEWDSGYYRILITSLEGKTTSVAFIKQ